MLETLKPSPLIIYEHAAIHFVFEKNFVYIFIAILCYNNCGKIFNYVSLFSLRDKYAPVADYVPSMKSRGYYEPIIYHNG